MNGFPGPLVKWMLDAISAEGIARTAIALGDPGASALCALLYVDGDTSVMAVGETRGDLTLPPRGEHGFGWDPVFQPEGSELSYAQLGLGVKDELGHRGRAWAAFAEKF